MNSSLPPLYGFMPRQQETINEPTLSLYESLTSHLKESVDSFKQSSHQSVPVKPSFMNIQDLSSDSHKQEDKMGLALSELSNLKTHY